MPGIIKLATTGQEGSVLKFKLTLPAAGATDVVSRELEVKIAPPQPGEMGLTITGEE